MLGRGHRPAAAPFRAAAGWSLPTASWPACIAALPATIQAAPFVLRARSYCLEAACHYCWHADNPDGKLVAVFDLGGKPCLRSCVPHDLLVVGIAQPSCCQPWRRPLSIRCSTPYARHPRRLRLPPASWPPPPHPRRIALLAALLVRRLHSCAGQQGRCVRLRWGPQGPAPGCSTAPQPHPHPTPPLPAGLQVKNLDATALRASFTMLAQVRQAAGRYTAAPHTFGALHMASIAFSTEVICSATPAAACA